LSKITHLFWADELLKVSPTYYAANVPAEDGGRRQIEYTFKTLNPSEIRWTGAKLVWTGPESDLRDIKKVRSPVVSVSVKVVAA
jgi:hypothetical protein